MRRVLGGVFFLAVVALSSTIVSCGGPPAASPYDVLTAPDERTATGWIAKAFRKQGFEVEGNREVKIGTGAVLIADVAATDDVWSVVWLRPDEINELKAKLPAPPAGVADGSLWVMSGAGSDAEQRMLILMAKNFEYDPDPRGKGVIRSMEEVEARTVRDVTDFLVRAKAGEIE
ncbi:MAG: hypothetical protein ABI175_19320 [Polyangiales bacterium]